MTALAASQPDVDSGALRVSTTTLASPWTRRLVIFGMIFALYVIGAWAAWDLFAGVVFFPPTGVSTIAVVLSRRTDWYAIGTAIVGAEMLMNLTHDIPASYSVGYAIANLIGPMLGGGIYVWTGRGSWAISDRVGLLRFLGFCCVCGPLVSGIVGASVRVAQSGNVDWIVATAQWTAGDGIGALIIAATTLMLIERRSDRRWWIELALTSPVMLAMSLVSMSSQVPSTLVMLPLFAWTATRLGVAGVSVLTSIFGITANAMTNAGRGPFAQLDMSPDSRLAWLQLSIAVVSTVSWLLAIEVTDRHQSVLAAARSLDREARTAELLAVLRRAVEPSGDYRSNDVDVAASYRAATSFVGGDWYDVVQRPSGSTLLTVGDVVGHGLPAVEDMTQLRYASRAFCLEGTDTASIATNLSTITESSSLGGMATLLLVEFEPRKAQCVVVSAGHPPPILISASGGARLVPLDVGPPLGFGQAHHYRSTSVPLTAGDLVVLYTDGLIERRDRPLDRGLDELMRVASLADPCDDLDVLCDWITDECLAGFESNDDVCVVVTRWLGAGSRTPGGAVNDPAR